MCFIYACNSVNLFVYLFNVIFYLVMMPRRRRNIEQIFRYFLSLIVFLLQNKKNINIHATRQINLWYKINGKCITFVNIYAPNNNQLLFSHWEFLGYLTAVTNFLGNHGYGSLVQKQTLNIVDCRQRESPEINTLSTK